MKNLFDAAIGFTPEDATRLINLVEVIDMAIAPLSNEALGIAGNSFITIVVELARVQALFMPEHLLRRKQPIIAKAFADARATLRAYGNTPAVGLLMDAMGMCEQFYRLKD